MQTCYWQWSDLRCGPAALYLPAEVGGELATPAELQRLVATLQGFPTTEEEDRQQLQVFASPHAVHRVLLNSMPLCSQAAVEMLHMRPCCNGCALMLQAFGAGSASCMLWQDGGPDLCWRQQLLLRFRIERKV